MSFLISIAIFFLALLVSIGVIVAACVLSFRVSRPVSWLYLRRCLVFSLPLLVGFVVFFVGFSRDPLWPNQDMTPAEHIEYRTASIRAKRIYTASAILSSSAVLWFIYRAVTSFREIRRAYPKASV